MNNPQLYSKNLDQSVILIQNILKKYNKLLKWSSEPESIFDMGIGDGKMTKEAIFPIIPTNMKEYIGGDISDSMLRSAERTICNEKFQTVAFDAQTENIPDRLKNRFHHVFSNFLLHHTQDVRQVLMNVWSMLQPGGQFVFNVFEELLVDQAYEKLDEGNWAKYTNKKSISPFYRSENRLREYEKIIGSVGFVDCHFFWNKFEDQQPLEIFEATMEAVNTRLPFIEEQDRNNYLKDFITETKKSKLVKIFTDEKTNNSMVHCSLGLITGIVSKQS